ncbi:MAG: ATP-binding cassette domain-containing protein [Clostridium sp.]|jgi:ABC transporter, ATP-binding protein|uniref:ATP-binding cassette domain-containing protein n=1 Tax=Clostridium sp. AM49-4BH TaxID=2293035 RepID=UPI000E487625|nr:ATP-binding cassette domain-containing protein [Clostridium sp. AM49-4BH]RHQ08692.1 ATP-binding cassette domain-containing protein [Clostridium sp. AM49-4BH]
MNISIEHVTKKIKDATVLKDICLEMKGGTVYGLQGKNGSGKTMLMRAISGLIRPTSGRIVINGEQLHKNISIPRSIGLLLENPSLLPEYDASQNLKLLAKMQGGVPEEEIRQLIRDVGLEDAGHKKVEKYSLGMKQRLGIAAAILGSPDIILLDEPINAIDGEGVEEIRSLILSLKNEKRIIIVACHDKEEMNLLADEIVHLRDGRIEGQENGGAA